MRKSLLSITILIISTILLSGCQSANQPDTQNQTGSVETVQTQTVTQQVTGITPEIQITEDTHTPQISYTREQPVTDNQIIYSILENLQPRYLSQFSLPGWYHFSTFKYYDYWVHIPELENENRFDMFLSTIQYHTYAPGFIWPTSIVLQDGSWGKSMISPQYDDYQFNEGGKQPDRPMTLENLDYIAGGENSSLFGHTSLKNFMELINDPKRTETNIEISRTFSGWVEQIDGKDVFVLLTRKIYTGLKPLVESTRQVIDREDQYTYFDMKNGGLMYEEYILYLEDGSISESSLEFNQHHIQYFESLPIDIQTLFDEAAQNLVEFLNR